MAVDNVSFEAPSGSVTVILGPNGAGKTSTIEVCEGFRTAISGSVRVLGLDPVSDHRALTERMGVMLQGGGVYPSARVRDVVSHFCALHNKGVNATQLIERVGLSNRSTGTWRKLSGGEQQRLSLALALAAGNVYFRDLGYLWQIFSQVWFFATPIVYMPALIEGKVPNWVEMIMKLNPMAVFAQGFRRSMYDNSFPGWDNLGACALVAVVSMVIGWSIFTKLSRRFAEEL